MGAATKATSEATSGKGKSCIESSGATCEATEATSGNGQACIVRSEAAGATSDPDEAT